MSIVVDGLTKGYRRGTPVLRGLSMTIDDGETFGLIGPNGAGKTTTFGCILGLLYPDSGSVLIDGQSPDAMSVRACIGYVPERQTFDLWMTGRQFLSFHHGLARLDPNERARDIDDVVSRVGLDESAVDRRIKSYSRGMLQRIGLAQALLGRPKYLFLDEPTSGMDPPGVLLVRKILVELKKQGTTIVLNSHQLDQLERVCDRVAFIRDGQVGSVERLDERPDESRTVELRFIAQPGDDERLSSIEGFVSSTPHSARFTVANDERCAALVKQLVDGGLRIVEVTPVEGKLERLFVEKPQ